MPRGKGAAKEPKDSVHIAGTLPPDTANGLVQLIPDLIASAGVRRTAVVEFFASDLNNHTEDGTTRVVVQFVQIEPLGGQAAETAQGLLRQAQGDRLGMMQFDDPASGEPGEPANESKAG